MIARLRERTGCGRRREPLVPEDDRNLGGGFETLREELGLAGGLAFAAVEAQRQTDHDLFDMFTCEDIRHLPDRVLEPAVLDRAQRCRDRDIVVCDSDPGAYASGIDTCATHVSEV
jgi:hypothetical protein